MPLIIGGCKFDQNTPRIPRAAWWWIGILGPMFMHQASTPQQMTANCFSDKSLFGDSSDWGWIETVLKGSRKSCPLRVDDDLLSMEENLQMFFSEICYFLIMNVMSNRPKLTKALRDLFCYWINNLRKSCIHPQITIYLFITLSQRIMSHWQSKLVQAAVELDCSYSFCMTFSVRAGLAEPAGPDWSHRMKTNSPGLMWCVNRERSNKANVIKENGSQNRGGMKAIRLKSGFAGHERGDSMMKFPLDFFRMEAKWPSTTSTHELDVR